MAPGTKSERSELNFYGPHLADWLKMRLHSLNTQQGSYGSKRHCTAIFKNSNAKGGLCEYLGVPAA